MFDPKCKILICDDMLTMRKIVRKTLTDAGFTNVTEARDGAEGWDLLSKAAGTSEPFQLVLSDWNMPNLMGIDLLRKVRADAKTQKTPFLLVTAEAEVAQIKEAVTAGVDGYVTKPFSPQTISEKLGVVWKKYHPAA
jgi:two-component system chemotaxis response regulator CheY